MRILLWHVHGSWTTTFVAGHHAYVVPVLPGRGPDGRGRAQTWDWPATVTEATPDELRAHADVLDVAVLQRPHEAALVERWTGRRVGVDLPAVYLEHNAPTGAAASTRHPALALDAVRDGRVPIVHVTHFNALQWDCGPARTVVVEHGVPDPGHRWSGERARVAAVVNEPVRRSRVAGTDLLLAVTARLPAAVYGMRVGELAPLARTRPAEAPLDLVDDLPQARLHAELARDRAYLHPYRWTSLGLSLLEAMALGVPVAATASTEAPRAVPAGAGVVSADPDELAGALGRWLVDPEEAREQGLSGRRHVLEHYAHDRFLDRWDRLLKEVAG